MPLPKLPPPRGRCSPLPFPPPRRDPGPAPSPLLIAGSGSSCRLPRPSGGSAPRPPPPGPEAAGCRLGPQLPGLAGRSRSGARRVRRGGSSRPCRGARKGRLAAGLRGRGARRAAVGGRVPGALPWVTLRAGQSKRRLGRPARAGEGPAAEKRPPLGHQTQACLPSPRASDKSG